MKIYSKQNVFDAALDRIRFLFDEFPNIVISLSGGKDSTVILNLALIVAREKNRLPLNVMFIDQEAEWDSVITYMRTVMYSPEIKPYWLQVPIKLFNATSTTDPWLMCWEPGKKWIREKEPVSITENIYGTDRFKEIFPKFLQAHFKGVPTAALSGVRCAESPARTVGLTNQATYKHITYGNVANKKANQYTFYPIYDWETSDVWKAIHDNGWPYCSIYDAMYQHGVPPHNMRVSNVHHETAVTALYFLQEVEADLWNRLTERISGISTVGQLKATAFKVRELPPMFTGWKEYRDHLLDNLITDPAIHAIFDKEFKLMDVQYGKMGGIDYMYKQQISAVLTNDYTLTKMSNFRNKPWVFAWLAYSKGRRHSADKTNKFITDTETYKQENGTL